MNFRPQQIIRICLAFLLLLSIHFTVNAEPFLNDFNAPWKDYTRYKEPTKRFLEMHNFQKIFQGLKSQGLVLAQKPFYDIVIGQEERGFMAYTASGHEFRVFQDIVRITLEEVLGLEFKRDFHFFRYPGDPSVLDYKSANDFLKHNLVINDNYSPQRDQIISANFTLFNNFDQKYECSTVFFELGRSFRPPKFNLKVAVFFKEMGMPGTSIAELFNIGKQMENDKAGTLFQIFDLSHQNPFNKNAYEFVDKYIYPSIKKGEPQINSLILSDLYQSSSSSQFLEQFRIVVNNYTFLNPYSSISIRRYDLNEPSQVKEYETKLRNAIKTIPFDKAKANLYKLKLKQYWQID
ncbi:MAG: hypothetical protein H0U49_03295 [Parachlamydiaceae bacterium]|nr:hypothetical protein [Parachlamydiaceae bacterium]